MQVEPRRPRSASVRMIAASLALAPLVIALLVLPRSVSAQEADLEVIRPDLSKIPTGEGWRVVNRAVTLEERGGETVVVFDEREGGGGAWLEDVGFENGTIEVMIRGKNVPQHSFVGIAFRGVDDQTYDAVYFRPFNFRADNPLSRSHHVQYVSHPDNTWFVLRRDHEGVYENEIDNPPNPTRFFRARIEVQKPEVRVFVNGEREPSLVVQELTERTGGKIGLWVGNGSDGSFAELVIRRAN